MISKAFAATFEPITGTGIFQTGGSTPGVTLERFFSTVLGFLTVIGGIAFLIYFVLGAFTWLTSSGDKQKVEKAQSYLTNAAIGIIIIVLAWAITGIVGTLVGVDILKLNALINRIRP
ncbi:MAG: hypothetical protein A2900_00885 [Candidatus Chisholmbacteria bacterium RIFCSPLOWO2_01_FULL_50_28]|uniref:Uncharacterized protein n=1 Tax=Candidatus Chisholmbacteria bacterium RIFCSPHIGHO2_01_FULL_52_32 TaxID=1797591 RepID=A0A1G1VUI1_9BACT|nr:MAG: hypothetical protein A2786_05945 [Candidatus Chisholmbacteria bacterium RIFCSPHIGHO2_01_FULL_52_32]OGY19644.1 MAG: hypothetical protein A2900_00885 [Candidatus Chisholmbacteria bacterium RIFCSPLOWO2_01_FULL_50_28]